MARHHKLKCWIPYYDAILSGDKKFDVRRNDRDFEVGDYVLLEKFDPQKGAYVTGSFGQPLAVEKRVQYILPGGQFGIEPGFVVLGF
jgi:hypothetical protein